MVFLWFSGINPHFIQYLHTATDATTVEAVVVACGDVETAAIIDRTVNTEAGNGNGLHTVILHYYNIYIYIYIERDMYIYIYISHIHYINILMMISTII